MKSFLNSHIYAILLLTSALTCGGCGLLPKNHKPQDPENPLDALRSKYEFYLSQYPRSADTYGFVGDHCDSLLISSLGEWAGYPINVYKAEISPGEWIRHPAHDCWPAAEGQGSDSSISKDMFVGLSVYMAGLKDSQGASRIVSYGESNNWIMGTAKDDATLLSKCLMSPGLASKFKSIAGVGVSLHVTDDSSDSLPVQPGYLGHLDILGIYADGLLFGGISGYQLALAKAYCEHSPRNALFCAVYHHYYDGDFSGVTSTLMDESLFPSDSLPTTSNHCTDYLWMREDTPSDWLGCGGNKVSSGVDFLIAAKVILQ